jgi:hypothetical protein
LNTGKQGEVPGVGLYLLWEFLFGGISGKAEIDINLSGERCENSKK